MKKYITIAALLAAGTSAFAVEDLKTLDEKLLKLSNVTLGNANGSNTITGSNNNVFFNVDGNATLDAYTLTFGFDKLPGSGTDPWLRLNNNQYGIKSSSETGMALIEAKWETLVSENLPVNTLNTFALTVIGTDIYFSNLTTGAYVSATTTNDDMWKISTGSRVYTNNGTVHVQLGQIADLTGLTAEQAFQVATTGTYSPIPEPSAFGLLAGLGALALVASRRRRK